MAVKNARSVRAAQRSKILDGHRSEGYSAVPCLRSADGSTKFQPRAGATLTATNGRPFIMRRSRPRSVLWLTPHFAASSSVAVGYRFGSRGEDAVVMRGMCISQHFPPHVISKARTNSNTVRACSNAVRVLSSFRSKIIRGLFEVQGVALRYFMLQRG